MRWPDAAHFNRGNHRILGTHTSRRAYAIVLTHLVIRPGARATLTIRAGKPVAQLRSVEAEQRVVLRRPPNTRD
jgi:hypothetical protein